MSKKIIFSIIIWFVCVQTYAQNKYYLQFHPCINKNFEFKSPIDSSLIANKSREYLTFLHSEGYLISSIDSFIYKDNICKAYYSIGERYKWIDPKLIGIESKIQRKYSFKASSLNNKAFKYGEFARFEEKILERAENSGYPFAMIWMDSIAIDGDGIRGNVLYDEGPGVTFDTLEIIGTRKVKSRFLQSQLNVYENDRYNQTKINHIPAIISRLNYIELEKLPQVIFRDNKARVILFLKDKRSNYVDGILGVLPNADKDGKLLLTGEANLGLSNLFQSGKVFKGSWKKFGVSGQLLDIEYLHPKLFATQFDISLNFNLLKQDSLFININRGIKIGQSLNVNSRLNLIADFKSSRKLSGESTKTSGDFNFQQYGMELVYDRLDNFFVPRKGAFLRTSFVVGNKTLKNTSDIKLEDNTIDYTKSMQTQVNLLFKKFFGLKSFATILSQISTGTVLNNKNLIFVSDLYQIGGFNSLRGFNERQFYTRDYIIGTLEFRLFLDKLSYFSLLMDRGYLYNPLNPGMKVVNATGLGAGISFVAGPGIFSFIYSLGSSNSQSFNFNQSKIHFGFTSKF